MFKYFPKLYHVGSMLHERAISQLGCGAIRPSRLPNRDAVDIEPAAVREQLSLILRTPGFQSSLRLQRFLSFVVEAALQGQADRLKAYTIAVEALDRDGNFDPQSDAIVRVEALRLRRALARYYGGPGRNDRLLIELPRGGYVPVFLHRPAATAATESGLMREPAAERKSANPRQVEEIFAQIRELGLLQRRQIAALSQELHAARKMLEQSRALLQATSSVLGGFSPREPPERRSALDRPHE